jgi:8-oxo-dGTP pyrophosphatase MutT (NUDIX family)
MPGPSKASPFVVRRTARGLEILAFRHPLAGTQLVKGTIESGETVEAGAVRELEEERGVMQLRSRCLARSKCQSPRRSGTL